MIKTYIVRLINTELLADIGATHWSTRIAANDMASAWRKFVVQRKAPIYRFGSELTSRPDDYDISLDRDTLPNIIGTT